MNYEALRSEALLHAGKARKMAAKLFNDPQASQVDAGDLLISMAQLVDLLCVAAAPAPAESVGEQFCLCHDELSLQMASGGAAPEGLYGRVTLKVNDKFVDYWPAAAPAPAPLTDEQLGAVWRKHCGGVPGQSTFAAMRDAIDAAMAGQGKEASNAD